MSIGVSVLLLTWNEEVNLPHCLESVRWSDDVVVFDSFSTDHTVEIAKAAGARVFQRKFDDYGSQREAARTQVAYRHPWVLALDADERVGNDLVEDIAALVQRRETPHQAYRMRRKDHFMGRWVKHATLYPTWFVRLYRPHRVHYESRSVHEYPIVDGTVGELKGHLLHYSFNKGLGDWLAKHNSYSGLEAQETLKSLRRSKVDWAGLFALADPVRRRRALKELSFRLPFRPTLKFVYMYLLRRGFLDGWAGLTYCWLLSVHERIIVLKIKELRRRQDGLPL